MFTYVQQQGCPGCDADLDDRRARRRGFDAIGFKHQAERDKPRPRRISFSGFTRARPLLCGCLLVAGALSGSALEAPQITGVQLMGSGRIGLTWSGTTGACDIQNANGNLASGWNTILHTSRTNALVSLPGDSGFFRVVASDRAATSLILTTTNVSTGDSYTLTREAQTNSDLLFDNLGDTNAATPVAMVLPFEELQKFDVAFDSAGGFMMVTTNGDPGGVGGVINSAAGPGANQITYNGFLTNATEMVLFSAISGPAAAKSGAKPQGGSGNSSAGDPGDMAGGVFSSVWCAAAWAGQNLGCQAAAVARTPGCIGFFPPKASGGYGYISNRTGVTLTVTATNFILTGTCDSKCITCCKDVGTGALSNCQ